ncbi:MAG: cupin domain-containing protein [Hyphomicrobiaceae bacterium]|nr:cupin domain-containing protein [Hyphomicrobiaceae bacterium]
MESFHRITALDPFEPGEPPLDRIVEGTPRTRTWNSEESADGTRHAGLWEATPGAWKIAYDEWEFCTILSGISEIEDEMGRVHRLEAGDSFVIRPGFSGIWRVIETTRKAYVICL